MVFLRKKQKKRGQPQWYAVKKKRIGKKVVDEWEIYLGTAETIVRKCKAVEPHDRIRIKSYQFGKLAAVLAINEELGFTNIINDITTKKQIKGLTVGEYLLITVFGRWCGPLSKKATAEYFHKSFLKFHFRIPHKMNAQNIFNHMKYIEDEATIEQISTAMAANLIGKGFTPSALYLDTTNFFSYIQKAGDLPKKGCSKQKQFHRNLVGLGLVASDENIPLLHHTYPGNKHDSKLIPELVDRILKRLEALAIEPKTVAIVMDKGNNSTANVDLILDKMHLIGSLKRNQVTELMRVPIEEYEYLYTSNKKHRISGYRGTTTAFGREFTIVVRYNPATAKRQQKSYEKAKAKFLAGMADLKARYERTTGRGRKMGQAGVIRKTKDLIHKNHEGVFKFEFDVEPKRLRYWVDEARERDWYAAFGKTAIFTDREEWSSEQIVRTYNGLYKVEDDFHWLKDTLLLPLTPMYVRKDASIRVHVFLCVVGLLFMRYLLWKLRDLDATPKEILGALEGIRVALCTDTDLKHGYLVVEEMTALQSAIYSRLEMWRYLKLN